MGEQAKPLLPFLQRGDELQRADPKVAYYCRMFACEEGMRTSDKTPEMRELLSLLVLQLEKTKPSAGLQGAEERERMKKVKTLQQQQQQQQQQVCHPRQARLNPRLRSSRRSCCCLRMSTGMFGHTSRLTGCARSKQPSRRA